MDWILGLEGLIVLKIFIYDFFFLQILFHIVFFLTNFILYYRFLIFV